MSFALRHAEIRIQADKVWLDAFLSFAPDVRGLVICAVPHIARLRDARETHLCSVLQNAGFGTLLLSMLTPYEDSRDADLRYDIALISQRLHAVSTWIDHQPGLCDKSLGIVATSTVAAASIRLALQEPELFAAIVSKAGRIDLAGANPLRQLQVPSLVILPGAEPDLLQPTHSAFALLGCRKNLLEIARASSSFIEPGTLDEASQAACEWLAHHLPEAPEEGPETSSFGIQQ